MKKMLLVTMAACLSVGSFAQDMQKNMDAVMAIYQDSLQKTVDKYQQVQPEEDVDPFLYQLMSATTYYNKPVRDAFNLDEEAQQDSTMDASMLAAYLAHPTRYDLTEDNLEEVRTVQETPASNRQPQLKVSDMVQVEMPTAEVGDVDPVAEKPKYWKYNANLYFQFSQSHVSNNWYKGGESSLSFLSGMTLEANYDNQQKVQWENKLEAKVGFISSPADSLHNLKTNNDLIRLRTKFGYQAHQKWYYTAMAELENQLFAGYKSNDPTVYSKFLAPLKFNASLGMDFKSKKENKYDISLALLPASVNLWYIRDSEIAEKHFAFDEGKHFKVQTGSRLQFDHTLFFAPNIKWTSHFYVFTSYTNTEGQWENTLDFAVNKWLSAKFLLNTRFDDAVTGSDIQLNESLSFGLSYTL